MGCVLQHAQAASGTPSEREIRHSEPAWVPEDASTGWGKKAIDTSAARRWGVIKMQNYFNFFFKGLNLSAVCPGGKVCDARTKLEVPVIGTCTRTWMY